jgi:4a-hydroxytetrahydrobiopterin dehydratase
MNLPSKHCVPCKKDSPALTLQEAQGMLENLTGWQMDDKAKSIHKSYKFKNFGQALAFVNQVGAIAETENHHPDVTFGWGYVNITLQTHSIGGLHSNDFVMAENIDKL